MTQVEFLQRILPSIPPAGPFGNNECYFVLGLGQGARHQEPCTSFQSIADHCNSLSAQGLDAYMALSLFGNVLAGRKQANALSCRSLWADIDAGKQNSVYQDSTQALAALVQFVQNTGLKPSVIVSSGKGLHVYWSFNKDIPTGPWVQMAQLFHALCRQEGLDIDPTRAQDTASVLRMPGTVHQKSGNVVTILKGDGPIWTAKAFLSQLGQKLRSTPAPTPQSSSARTSALQQQAMAAVGMIQPPTANAEPIVHGCPQLLTMGLSQYPQWFAAMAVLRRCKDGLTWAHRLSAMDPNRYDPQDTEKRFYEAAIDAPTLCSTFERINPGLCAKCKHKGTVKTPVQLHRVAVQIPVDPAISALVGHIQHLDMTKPFDYPRIPIKHPEFTVDHRGIVWRVMEKDSQGNWQSDERIICTSQLYYKHGIYEIADNRPKRSHIFEAVHPNGKTETLRLSIDEDLSLYGIMHWFNNGGMYPTSVNYTGKVFMAFMNAYLQSVTHQIRELPTVDDFGWRKFTDPATNETVNGLVVGKGIITGTGIHDVRFGPAAKPLTTELGAKGSIETWKHFPRMYRILNQPIGQLAVCLGFAAPFMKYALGEANSAVLSLWSTASGVGKTHMLRVVASIWGDPMSQFISRQASSVARQRKLAVLNNLPAFMDEMTDVSDDDLYSLAYTLIGGKEKDKLKSGGEGFVLTGTWATVTYMTANRSFKSAISRRAGDSDATLLRVMEYECDFQSYEHNPQVNRYITECVEQVKNHYGLAGPELVYQILQRPERIAMLPTHIAHWIHTNKFANNERFISNALAAALIVGRWCVEYGLLDYDMDALEQWVLTQFVQHNRGATEQWSVDFRDEVSAYLISRQMNTLVVKGRYRASGDIDPGVKGLPDKYVISYPQREVLIRVEQQENALYIARSDFNGWCKSRNISPSTVKRHLDAKGITLGEGTFTLGRNLTWMPPTRIRCYTLSGESMVKLGYTPPTYQPPDDMLNMHPTVTLGEAL